jgi:hypothetical protein
MDSSEEVAQDDLKNGHLWDVQLDCERNREYEWYRAVL